MNALEHAVAAGNANVVEAILDASGVEAWRSRANVLWSQVEDPAMAEGSWWIVVLFGVSVSAGEDRCLATVVSV